LTTPFQTLSSANKFFKLLKRSEKFDFHHQEMNCSCFYCLQFIAVGYYLRWRYFF